MSYIFFFTTPVPPQIYSLSLHDALPISRHPELLRRQNRRHRPVVPGGSTGVEHSWTSQPAPPVTAVLTERLYLRPVNAQRGLQAVQTRARLDFRYCR